MKIGFLEWGDSLRRIKVNTQNHYPTYIFTFFGNFSNSKKMGEPGVINRGIAETD